MFGLKLTTQLVALYLLLFSQTVLAGWVYCYEDLDHDGFGTGSPTFSETGQCPEGRVSNNLDCDDTNDTIYYGAPDPPDGIDQSCTYLTTCYEDMDQDGYGSDIIISTGGSLCLSLGQSTSNLDCDDSNLSINPGATEICDDLDNDCDLQTDEGGVCPVLPLQFKDGFEQVIVSG